MTNRGRSRLKNHLWPQRLWRGWSSAYTGARRRLQDSFAHHPERKSEASPDRTLAHWLERRLRWWFLLGLAAVWLGLLLTKVSPKKVADLLLPETYLIFLFPLGLGTFALASLVLARRAALYSTGLVVLVVFCQLHHVVLAPSVLIAYLIIISILEGITLLVKKM